YPEAEAWRIQAEVDSAASYIEEGSALDSDNKPVEANACLMKAVEAFSALVEKYPDDAGWTPYLKFEIGLAHLLAGDKASAKTAFLRLAADHADNCWTWAAFNHMDLGVERPARPKTVRIVEDER
ncbi:MAG: tetratricopeptide repeat protein, partial [Phycisphaerae bacterium]|nr:tetratricopeptide repeat protein [Phycisphaerae bacterium]